MSRKVFKVKTNYFYHVIRLFLSELSRTFLNVKNNYLQHDNVFNKKYPLDNYNHLRHNKK